MNVVTNSYTIVKIKIKIILFYLLCARTLSGIYVQTGSYDRNETKQKINNSITLIMLYL